MLGCRFHSFKEIVDYFNQDTFADFVGNHVETEHKYCGYFIRNEYFTSEIFLQLIGNHNGN